MNSKKRCRQCKTYHRVESGVVVPLGFFCSSNCRKAYGIDKAMQLATKAKKERVKAARSDLKIRKEKLKTAGDYIKEAQTAFNRYIRLRDHKEPCISCGEWSPERYGGGFDCGHYRSTGSASHLRFNVYNANKQCKKCNRYLSGNVADYRPRLINKFGLERVEALENNNTPKRFTIDYLKRIKTIFNKKANKLEKRIKAKL